ncbi:MAG: hypothetical protein B7X53_00075 [Hyphomonas sp. 34-62-18]|nr:neutral zinc metallopeptidase [Hyphomonas sp. 34-62-18]OZB19397.1 MAG: hypothetical protein B7X53_00075 [Hyphomonas sp. 34-62-18]
MSGRALRAALMLGAFAIALATGVTFLAHHRGILASSSSIRFPQAYSNDLLAERKRSLETRRTVQTHVLQAVLGLTEDHWKAAVRQSVSGDYAPPLTVAFDGGVSTGCGVIIRPTEPTYCATDQQIYVDPTALMEAWRGTLADTDAVPALLMVRATAFHVLNQSGSLAFADVAHAPMEYSSSTRDRAECLTGVWGAYATEIGVFSPGEFMATVAAYNERANSMDGSAQTNHLSFERGFANLDIRACMILMP